MDETTQVVFGKAGSNRRTRRGAGPPRRMRPGILAAGGVLGALAASSCCILPLVLVSLGIGGAWMGHVTALALPYLAPLFADV